MWDLLFVFVTIICTCPDTDSVKNLSRELWPRNVTNTLTPRPTMTASSKSTSFLFRYVCRATLKLYEVEHQVPSCRMNSLTQRVARQRFAICCQLLHPTRRAVKVNCRTTSCCTCQTHVGKRASNSSTRTLQKRLLRFRSSVLRVGRARNFFGNQARQLGMEQRPALQCGAVGTCCFRGLDVHQNMFLRCRRGTPFLQFFKLSHIQLRAHGVRAQDKDWFVLTADLFNIRSICSGTRA